MFCKETGFSGQFCPCTTVKRKICNTEFPTDWSFASSLITCIHPQQAVRLTFLQLGPVDALCMAITNMIGKQLVDMCLETFLPQDPPENRDLSVQIETKAAI